MPSSHSRSAEANSGQGKLTVTPTLASDADDGAERIQKFIDAAFAYFKDLKEDRDDGSRYLYMPYKPDENRKARVPSYMEQKYGAVSMHNMTQYKRYKV